MRVVCVSPALIVVVGALLAGACGSSTAASTDAGSNPTSGSASLGGAIPSSWKASDFTKAVVRNGTHSAKYEIALSGYDACQGDKGGGSTVLLGFALPSGTAFPPVGSYSTQTTSTNPGSIGLVVGLTDFNATCKGYGPPAGTSPLGKTTIDVTASSDAGVSGTFDMEWGVNGTNANHLTGSFDASVCSSTGTACIN